MTSPADKLIDAAADFVASQVMRGEPDPDWSLIMEHSGGQHLVSVTLDGEMVARERSGRLHEALTRALEALRECIGLRRDLERTLDATRGRIAANDGASR